MPLRLGAYSIDTPDKRLLAYTILGELSRVIRDCLYKNIKRDVDKARPSGDRAMLVRIEKPQPQASSIRVHKDLTDRRAIDAHEVVDRIDLDAFAVIDRLCH